MSDLSSRNLYSEITASNHYHLGTLEAKVLKDKIYEGKKLMKYLSLFYSFKGFNEQKILELSKKYEYAIEPCYIQEMKGMADTLSNIDYSDILLQNTILDILYGHIIPSFDKPHWHIEFGCTSFALNHNNKVDFAQTFDFWSLFQDSLEFVNHSFDKSRSIFGLRMGASLNIPMGMTSHTAMLLNVVKTQIVGDFYEPMTIRTRRAFENSRTSQELLEIMTENPSTMSCNLIFCDPKSFISIETNPIHTNFEISKLYAVNTNTYTNKLMQKYLMSKTYSKKRQKIAEQLLFDKIQKQKSPPFIDLTLDEHITRNGHPFESSTLAYFSENYFGFKREDKIFLQDNPILWKERK